jgi:TP901 family phage tail tape measure protein
MAEDNVQANIRIGIDTSDALVSIKNLQRQISAFHTSMANGSAANAAAASNFQKTLIDNINATKKFSASVQTVRTTTETFTNALEKNKLSLGQYFRYAGGASKSFGRVFATEFDTINKVARERVKDLQTQYIRMGRDASGAMKAIAVRPLMLDMDNLATKTAIAAQRQQLLNQLLKQGSTNLLNFGKNTQWAGRQLMVGFTIPLSIFGATAAKSFMTIEEQAIRFRRVYGDLMTDPGQTEGMLDSIKQLASEFTKYGVAVDKTLGLAASAAAQGKTGADLTAQVAEATRLSVLGQVEQQQALDTTISVTNAFGVASADLASKIDFLNAVENQTVTSIEDLTIAIPKAGPVVKQLGGDVEDLTFFLTAMKEGGINASEGANALKSGLASLINPTEKASAMLAGFGININGIVESNKGDVKGIVIDFATALDKLDPLGRARAIEQLFGKFQFSRLSTLFQNVIGEGTQAQRVLDLAATSSQGLAELSARELGKVSESSMFKFKKSIEDIKLALAPVGETFLKLATPVIEFGTKILNAFNSLDERTKNFVTGLVAVVGGIGPILLMTFGLLANGIANIIKGFTFVKNVFNGASVSSNDLGSQISYMTNEQIKAASVAASLDQVHGKLTQTFTSETNAIGAYVSALQRANTAAAAFNVPAVGRARPPQKFATGGFVSGSGNKDTVPAMLTPGEFVVKKDVAQKVMPFLEALNSGLIAGFNEGGVAGSAGKQMNIPGGPQLGHFSQPVSVAGKELLALARASVEQGKSTQKELAQVIATVGDNLDGLFKVFDNRVERISDELNQMVGDVGSGKTAPKDLVQRDLVERGRDARLPMIDRLKKAGVSTDDALLKADKITEEVKKQLDLLGKEVKLTAEDINRLTQKAYEAVAATDKDVEAAYQEMKKIETYKDESGARGARGQRESFGTGYIKQKNRIKTMAENLPEGSAYGAGAFKTTREMSKIAGMTEQQIQQMFKNLPDRLKRSVYNELKNGTANFVSALLEASETGAVNGIEVSTAQASPSKKAFDAGANIGRGAIQGIESQIDDAQRVGRKNRRVTAVADGSGGMVVQRPATQASDFAGTSASRTPRRAFREADADVRAREAFAQEKNTDLVDKNSASVSKNTAAVGRFGSATTNGILGVTTLAFALSSIPGPVGEVASRVSALSGVIYGLSIVTEMLTKQKILETLITRKNNALAATRSAFGVDQGASLFGKGGGGFFKNLFTNFSKFGVFFKNFVGISLRFAGIIGIVASGLLLLGDSVKKQIKKQNEYADALKIPQKQTSAVASFFGVAPKEAKINTPGTQMVVAPQQREEVKKFADSEEAKGYGAQIDALKSPDINASQARSIVGNVSMNLQAQGVAEEQINAVLTYLQEQAGRTDLKLSFKNFDITTKDGTRGMQKTVVGLASKFAATYEKGIEERTRNVGGKGGGKTVTEKGFSFGKEGKAAAKATKELVDGTNQALGDLEIAFTNGLIDGKQFSNEMTVIGNTLANIGGTAAFDEIFKSMENNPTAQMAIGLKDTNDQMMVLTALQMGLGPQIQVHLNALKSQGTSYDEIIAKARARAEIEAITAGNLEAVQKALDSVKTGADDLGGSGTKVESAFEKAMNQIKGNTIEALNQVKAFNKLKAAGYGTEKAFELAKDPILAAALAAEKVGSKKWKQLTAELNKTERAAKNVKNALLQTVDGASDNFDESYSKVTEKFSALQEELQIAFDKANKTDNNLISNSQSQIAGLEYTLDDLNAALDDIQIQEDAINEKYDKRLDALDKIQSANDQIARQQSSQLTIADALSQGDIAAAAKAIQDARAEEAQANLENQRKNIDAARASEINGLTVNGKTKAQINAEVLSIQKQIKKIEEESLEPAQERIRLAEEKLQKDIDNLVVLGKTKSEWDEIVSNIRIAKTETEAFTTAMLAALGAATNLKNVLSDNAAGPVNTWKEAGIDVAKATKDYTNSRVAFESSGLSVSGYMKALDRGDNFGFKSAFTAAGGGMVPKYFAAGGFARGTDTVPSMLTPGEFVVKKYAVQDFGADKLKAINNGTYSGESVYNYELNVNVKSDANPDEIARTVMTQIKQIDSQRLRGNRL